MEKIEAACRNNTRTSNEDHMGVVLSLALPRDHLRAEVHQQDHMVELKQRLIEKDGEAPYARVIIQHQGVLVLVEIVQTALRYPILNLNATLDVLLVRKLHLVLCLIPFLG